MAIGILGKKVGMTSIIDQQTGKVVPVTIVEAADNVYIQRKTQEKDGYSAIQVGYDDLPQYKLTYPKLGHFRTHSPGKGKRFIREFRVENDDQLPADDILGPQVADFQVGDFVDVVGTTIGKGFQGVMKRHGFHGQRQTHGSMMHRRPGAVSAGTTPGRIWKGKKMPGRMGNKRRTTLSLEIMQIREEDNAILLKGSVAGHRNSFVSIRPAFFKRPETEQAN